MVALGVLVALNDLIFGNLLETLLGRDALHVSNCLRARGSCERKLRPPSRQRSEASPGSGRGSGGDCLTRGTPACGNSTSLGRIGIWPGVPHLQGEQKRSHWPTSYDSAGS